MQGKGVVKFFLVLLAVICLYQLLFFVPANRVESAAAEYAAQVSDGIADEVDATDTYNAARRAYLDSMSNETVWAIPGIREFTYADVKQQQVNLGLDLKGGMSVVMRVDLRSFLESLADGSSDPDFVAALDRADAELAQAQSDYITLFVDAFLERVGDSGKNLASIFSRNEILRERINFETSNGEVARLLRERADETVDLTFSLLKERIDRTGVLQPNVSLDEARDLILVELPGIDNPERARQLLQSAAALDFYDVYRNSDPGIFEGLISANTALTAARGGATPGDREVVRVDTTYAIDELGNEDRSQVVGLDTVYADDAGDAGALFSVLAPYDPRQGQTAVIGVVNRRDRAAVERIFADETFTRNFPQDAVFAFGQKPIRNAEGEFTSGYPVYALRTESGGEPALSGTHIVEADQSVDVAGSGEVEVNITMDQTGSREWAEITTSRVNREFAIVLDGEVVSAPNINQPITQGRSRITGGFTVQEAQDLATKLEIGRLPAEPRIVQESIVGPSLGAENIRSSVLALCIGFALVLLFMVAYYGGAGIVSILALLANVFFIFGALSSFGTVLTLPGIAGIVLTIGMAVDANVIIYERIREELRAGKTTLAAIRDGFDASYSAIIDANVTTLLTALVLNYWGLGPIKGFAVVLMIGIFTSLFTAVLVTRLIIDARTSGGGSLGFLTGFSEKVLAAVDVDWMSKRKLGYAVSGVLIVASLASILTRGFDLGVDFTGGYSYTVAFVGDDVERDDLETALVAAFDGESTVVKAVDAANTYNVTTSYLVDDPGEDASERVEAALFSGVQSIDDAVTLERFTTADLESSTRIISSTKVGPTIADDIRNSSLKSGVFALILIFLYLFIRFSRWEFSAGAVAALFHDVIITLGVFSLLHGILPFSMEIDQAFVAAILTVIGYSVNDTVVVFDRIREFIGTYTGRSKEEIFNLAINSTLSRTLITSLTTLFVVAILFLFGGDSIRGFAFALLVGILIGTYSSIFVASATVNDLVRDIEIRKTSAVATGVDKESSFTRAARAKRGETQGV